MSKILLGVETGSIEDYTQCVLIDVPDDVDDVEEWLDENREAPFQQIVGVDDVNESFRLAMLSEGISADVVKRIEQTVWDAIDNND